RADRSLVVLVASDGRALVELGPFRQPGGDSVPVVVLDRFGDANRPPRIIALLHVPDVSAPHQNVWSFHDSVQAILDRTPVLHEFALWNGRDPMGASLARAQRSRETAAVEALRIGVEAWRAQAPRANSDSVLLQVAPFIESGA